MLSYEGGAVGSDETAAVNCSTNNTIPWCDARSADCSGDESDADDDESGDDGDDEDGNGDDVVEDEDREETAVVS
jgi:hypothetical protein